MMSRDRTANTLLHVTKHNKAVIEEEENDWNSYCFTLLKIETKITKMNFRQRIAWLTLLIFLAISFALAYYIFEISDSYNILALEHVSNKASLQKNTEHSTIVQRIKGRVLSLPFWFWILILLVPYLQVFCMLLACTKTNPKNASLMMVPVCILLKLVNCGERSPTLLTADLLET